MPIAVARIAATRSWVDLCNWADASGCRAAARALTDRLTLEDARFLLRQLARVDPPERVQELTTYQRWQDNLGGSFHGMLPDQLVDAQLPVPDELPGALRAIARFAEVRAGNDAALAAINPDYATAFTGQRFPTLGSKPYPDAWAMTIDVSGLRALLDLLGQGRPSPDDTRQVAELEPFQAMMAHRRNLGYVPEPLVDTDGFAAFIQHAGSDDPLDRIWAWLSSQNFFDLADLAQHRDDYERLSDEIASHACAIEAHILGTIAPYATDSMRASEFRDRISFAVGWGIAGWAAATSAGVNVEQFKDDYERLLTTLAHESVHRWQLWIGRPDGTRADSFEHLTELPFADERDRSFYAILSYIMLEGTATHIAPSHAPEDRRASIQRGTEVLGECHRAIYEAGDSDKADALVNEGLRSNGPFYWLGEALTRAIVAADGPQAVGRTIRRGAPSFLRRGLEAASDTRWAKRLGDALGDPVRSLERRMP